MPRAAALLMISRARWSQPMPSDEMHDYQVGYAKPPCQTRFRKGQSGNPKGRTAGDKNLSTLLREALNEHVVVTDNGRRRKITKPKATVTQPVNRSASRALPAGQ